MQIRVYYEDTDAGGVVYYANYLKYFERGRTEYLRHLGFEQDALLAQNIVFAVKQIEVSYQQPARFDDMLEVSTTVAKLGKVRLDFNQTVRKGTQVLTTAKIQVVCLKADSFTACAIPIDILDTLKENNAST